jgi:hypothetical protein
VRTLAVAAVAACHGGGEVARDGRVVLDSTADAAIAAPQLASGGTQVLTSGPRLGLQITPADLASDVDVIEIHQEFYGVPWDAFAVGQRPPAAWVAIMDELATSAHATGKPVLLSISMLDGGRSSLAARTVIDGAGQVQSVDHWAATCYDFASAPDAAIYRQAYLAYVGWMLDEFSPHWLNHAIEVNLFFEHCPAATAGLVELANEAYATAKARSPALIAFPSIEIDHLYGYADGSCSDPMHRDACFVANYAQIAPLMRDRFAMSSYPIPLAGMTAATLPADWFTRGAEVRHEIPLIAETGANSTSLVVDVPGTGCHTVFTQTQTDAAAYLARVLGDAQAARLEVVNWWSDRDLVVAPLMTACPCTFDATWCAVLDAFRGSDPDTQVQGELALKVFGTMGLRDYSGSPKPLYAQWQAARAGH